VVFEILILPLLQSIWSSLLSACTECFNYLVTLCFIILVGFRCFVSLFPYCNYSYNLTSVTLNKSQYIKRRKWGLSKTQLSWFSIYSSDSDYMFRPCLAIFRSQCWRHTQMRNTQLYVHRSYIMINEISLLRSVVTCLISWGVGYCRKIWLAGVVAVFLVTLACGSCVADIVLDRAGACAWSVGLDRCCLGERDGGVLVR
jgi:hypothetical protein